MKSADNSFDKHRSALIDEVAELRETTQRQEHLPFVV
ncbi:hypothetical protein EDD52_1851 [Primorskyibacter sedentarius]|uniref:Uncharacterized protein n=1 Tax=Primorskyibacter sedentarius TaxID=745311 RepID=A0A4R3IF47_9RHOB|nr:hypothetical protein EDD52_1851 [Primorskyibacter sedentarius]